MKLYAAITTTAMIHSATTKYSISQPVRVDIDRGKAFALYHTEASRPTVFFKDPAAAIQYAKEQHYKSSAMSSSGFFASAELYRSFDRSNDAKLNKIYGDGVVMKESQTMIVYQVDADPSDPALGRAFNPRTDSYTFSTVRDRGALDLESATTQSHIHDFSKGSSKDIIPHKELAVNPQGSRCSIM